MDKSPFYIVMEENYPRDAFAIN